MIFRHSRLTTDDSRPGRKGYPGYGFTFWLAWISGFAGSFIMAAGFWTFLIRRLFGEIRGPELTFTWAAAVFGTWFLALIPFMRKKEQIWKRLNPDEESAVDAWLLAMGATIAVLVASTFFWTWRLSGRVSAPGFDSGWIKAVASSALIALVPLLIFMYRKADDLFRTAERRQSGEGAFRSVFVALSERTLADGLAAKLAGQKALVPGGHVVTAILRDGRRVPDVFVRNCREIQGIYDRHALDFSAVDVVDLEVVHREKLPPYEEEKWLRVDGKNQS